MAPSPGSIRPGQGPVEVSGTARVADRSFTSPLTEQECVAYRLEKEVYAVEPSGGHKGGGKTWQTIRVDEAGVPFYVEDGGERVLVDGSTADLDMERSYVVETSDFEESIAGTMLARVTGGETDTPEERREVADEYADEVASANNPRRYTEWVIHVGEAVTVRGEAVSPEETPIGSSLATGISGPTEPASGGIVGTIKGTLGVADEVPADPRARYKPRAIERLPAADVDDVDDATGDGDDPVGDGNDTAGDADDAAGGDGVEEVRDTVSMFEGVPQGGLSENPDAVQFVVEAVEGMTDEELRVADEAMPDAPALDEAGVVISWGQGSEFVVTDSE